MNKTSIARSTAALLFCCSLATVASAQYYYKDIVVTAQINAGYRALRDNKVSQVTLATSTPGAAPEAVITVQQTLYPAQRKVVTYTKSPGSGESWLTAVYDENGLLQQTTDSAEEMVTRSQYRYDASNRVLTLSSNAVPVNSAPETEVHQWTYNSNGQPQQMIKIKDNRDTTFVSFVPDEQGNTGEEKVSRKQGNLGSTFYYYDAQHRLTDVARFNRKANRILPDYMFEYGENALPSQMILVPEGSNDYQVWKYIYNAKGLKEKDLCYNKQKQLVGTVTYSYTFAR
ncbi:MAG TPA: hypothetical protein VL307_01060 [Chitinophagaceae bacterium]|nr:hypothetical protein [Chitinophagaceae bacterium]